LAGAVTGEGQCPKKRKSLKIEVRECGGGKRNLGFFRPKHCVECTGAGQTVFFVPPKETRERRISKSKNNGVGGRRSKKRL